MNRLQRFACFLIIISLLLISACPFKVECAREEFNFTHPMTVINIDESEIVKDRVKKKIEPQYSAFNQLLAEAKLVQSFTAEPPKMMTIMGGYEANSNLSQVRYLLWRNAHAAYTSALAYHYTRESKYADQAIAILNAWANQEVYFTGKDAATVGFLFFSNVIRSRFIARLFRMGPSGKKGL